MSSLQTKNSFSVLTGLLFFVMTAIGCGGGEESKGVTDAGGPDGPVPECLKNEDCDDDIACTDDLCRQGACQSAPNNAKCQAGETCEPDRGGCFKAKSCFNDEQCDDSLDCTVEGCNTQTKLCETIYDDARCSAGSVCLPEHPEADYYTGCVWGKRCASATDCASEFACVIGECYFRICKQTTNDRACDDQISCTQDSCSLTEGCLNAPSNYACDDNNPCNGAERCDPQQDCQPGLPPTCDDQIACTVDSCDPDYGCQQEANDALCDDHDVCTGTEYCDAYRGCQHSQPLDCSDYIDCTEDSCQPDRGCIHEPDDTLCDDQISCTADSCNSDYGCRYAASDALCDDHDVCTGTEYCDPYSDCQPGTPLNCGDRISCTEDSCDPVDGCIHQANDALCDDQISCTTDSCQPESGCLHQSNDALCDDHNPCNGAEQCSPYNGCQPDTPLNCNDYIDCTVDSCQPELGCIHEPCSPLGGECGTTRQCYTDGYCVAEDEVTGKFKNGYCIEFDCAEQNYQCPAGGICVMTSQEGDTACFLRCEKTLQDCRPEYTCLQLTSGGEPVEYGVCWTRLCSSDTDCNVCAQDTDCAGVGRTCVNSSCNPPYKCDRLVGACDPVCTENKQCYPGRLCDTATGNCYTPCAADAECGADADLGFCDPTTGKCVVY